MKNSLEDLNNRFHLEGERICKLEGRSIKITQSEEWGEKEKENEEKWEMWGIIKHTNIRIMGPAKGEETEKGTEKSIWRNNGRNFPSLMKNVSLYSK